MDYKIREMTPDDWPAVSKIYAEGIAGNLATFQNECPPYSEWDAAHLAACRLILLDGGNVAGWVALSPVSSRCVYAGVAEVSIYVADSRQGRGVGSCLLNALVEQSEQAGFWTLQSGIMADNTASIRLHEKCGFHIVGRREKIGRDRFGVWRDTVLMERRSRTVGIDKEDCSCCPK